MDTIDADAGTAMKKKWNYAAAAAAVAADTAESVSDWLRMTIRHMMKIYARNPVGCTCPFPKSIHSSKLLIYKIQWFYIESDP